MIDKWQLWGMARDALDISGGGDRIRRGGKISKFRSDCRGTTAIELGVIGSLLFIMGIGIGDFGIGFWEQMQVGDAARAGGEYAIVNGWNQSGIETAVTGATGLGAIEATPAPTEACGCPSASAGIVPANCGADCRDGETAGTYVTVHAQHAYPTNFKYPGISNPLPLTATIVVRIQ